MTARGKITSETRPGGTHSGGYRHVENQAWMLAPPWIGVLLLAVAGPAVHSLVAGSTTQLAWVVFGLTLATVVLFGIAVFAARPRGLVTRIVAPIAVGLAGLWLVTVTIVGARIIGLWLAYGLVASTLALAANLRYLLHGGGDNAGHRGGQDWDELAGQVKVLQARLRAPKQIGATVTAGLELPAGTTIEEAQADARRLAGPLKVGASAVRIAGDPDDASQAQIIVTAASTLTGDQPWTGVSRAGGSMADPIHLGSYEDGEPAVLWPAGDEKLRRNAIGLLILLGQPGAGKTVAMRRILAETESRHDGSFSLADPRKFGQLPAWARKRAKVTASTPEEVAGWLDLLERRVAERATELGAAGHDQWVQGCGLDLEVWWLDEASGAVESSEERMVSLAESVRSVGIWFVCCFQRVTADRVPSSLKSAAGGVLVLGCRPKEGQRLLSPSTIEAGADPGQWGNKKPGMFYLEVPGVDEDRWPIPAKVIVGDDTAIDAELTALGSQADAEPVRAEPADPDWHVQGYEPPAGMADELTDVDPDAELDPLPEGMDEPLGPPRVPPMSQADAEEHVDLLLADLREQGVTRFRRRDLIKAGARTATGKSLSWLSGYLAKRAADGTLVDATGDRADGWYTWATASVGHDA